MRSLFTLALCLIPGLALATPQDGSYQNDKGAILTLKSASADGFDFTLTAGGPAGAATCPEGATDCLGIQGHASAIGTGYVYVDPNDNRSRMFMVEEAPGMRVMSTMGDMGAGTANRDAVEALTGAYPPATAAPAATQPAAPAQTATATQPAAPAQQDATTPPAPAAPAQQQATAQPATPAPAPSAPAATAPAATAPAAKAELHDFHSPSGNIDCQFSVGDTVEVRCDLSKVNRSFAVPPKDCNQDWGDSFSIAGDGATGVLVCHGDTVASPDSDELAFGRTLTYGDVTCQSKKAGMTCRNTAGHGFTVSRKEQTLF